jgi:hypothetical protein
LLIRVERNSTLRVLDSKKEHGSGIIADKVI